MRRRETKAEVSFKRQQWQPYGLKEEEEEKTSEWQMEARETGNDRQLLQTECEELMGLGS